MILLATVGAMFGAGGWVIIRGLTRRHNPSLRRIAQLPTATPTPRPTDLKALAMEWSNSVVLLAGTDFKKLAQALRITGKTPLEHSWAKVSTALLWGIGPAVLMVLARTAGFKPPLWWLAPAMIFGVVAGFRLADKQLLDQAEKHRAAFRGAFVAYLDLVKVLLAGGSHTDGALYQAAQAGHGPTFDEIRATLDWSRVNGLQLSAGLTRLGDDLGLTEFSEVGATIELAETEGAVPSEVLARKAEAAANKALADAQAEANALAEKMSMPTVVIAFTFVVFIAYPALSSLSSAI